MYAAVGAAVLIPSALLGLLIVSEPRPGAVGSLEFVQSALLAPLFYAFLGWPATALVCIVYNLIARLLGGVEYFVEEDADPVATGEPHGTRETA